MSSSVDRKKFCFLMFINMALVDMEHYVKSDKKVARTMVYFLFLFQRDVLSILTFFVFLTILRFLFFII